MESLRHGARMEGRQRSMSSPRSTKGPAFYVDDNVCDGELARAKFLHEPDVGRSAYGFVVATTVTGLRRLHFVGNCGGRPGEHFLNLECF